MGAHRSVRVVWATLSLCALLTTFCVRLEAQRHPLYKPNKVTGVPTYQSSGEVATVFFSLQEIPRDLKEHTGLVDKVEFAQGSPPTISSRGFLACTLKEAMDYITKKEATASNFQLQGNLKLVNKSRDLLESDTARNAITGVWPGRNTAGADTTGTIERKLKTFPAGEYTLYVDTYVTYDYVVDKLTGRKAPSNILIAAGKLPILVK